MSKQKPEIEIYSLEWCPYCEKAKALIKSKGFSYEEFKLNDEGIKEEMEKRTDGAKTVPQIFIDGKHIGGYDQLVEVNTSGELDPLLGLEEEDSYSEKFWDLIIIGAGPAAFSSALYAVRKGLDVLILAKDMGGQILETDVIENYPGISSIAGSELAQSYWQQVQDYAVTLKLGEEVTDIEKLADKEFKVMTSSDKEIKSKSIIIATGAHSRKLGVMGENRFKSNGVHYCAICDGYMYAGKKVAVIGGGNSGLEAALDLAKIDCQVSLVEFEKQLNGDKVLQKKVAENDSIQVYTGSAIQRIIGEDKVEEIEIQDRETEEFNKLEVEGVFIEIGYEPNSEFVEGIVKINDYGEIIINNNNNMTSVEGIWAAGDVTNIKDKQVIVAAAEGAKAALRVNKYLS
ncbi:MAG: glutaredoxin 3 [Bacillota bacterium]